MSSVGSVRWLECGSTHFAEPFFGDTIRRVMRLNPAAGEQITDLQALLDAAGQYDTVRPSGVIFHVSRCGSTVLTNALKTGARVVARKSDWAWPARFL
jgi:hypothetical protein